ncbi:Citron Rho-interacting kinase [Echinococcus granulosus]|uniref:Citron Rho-interacting kinase n=1 Tax=Echinococcus granulosus TaxID=6210 RepID=U6J0D3_ECHGR|nr:Citron Rho-interacting kinase [Echinococcus granulosus]EUB59122.1 Citron Rho-interacting kinase [Echinococcus granulosus]CDS15160.1 citron Rho interacting kinase [Echinococcus granulosus]
MADNSSLLSTSTPVHARVVIKTQPNFNSFSSLIQNDTPKAKVESQPDLSVAQRTRALFNIISRPPLLCAPSFGIELPFESVTKAKSADLEKASKELKDLACADLCLLSVDGLLDGLYVARNAVEHLYDECETLQAKEHSDSMAATLNVLDFFLNRVDPILRKLIDLRVSMNDFTLGEIIGRGACGVVRVVHEKTPPHSVLAMKSQFKGSWLFHDPEGAQLLLERTVLAQAMMIDNPWLPHLHYAFQDESQLHLVMDYEPGGDMYIFLSKAAHLLDSEMIQFYAAEVVEATHSLHQMGYIHCDIKPENFAIERSGHLKLIDFGSAIRLDSNGKCVCPTMVGTKEYLNIELLTQRKRGAKDSLRVGPCYDYWAIGVFIYEMFYTQTPFYDENDDKMMDNIINFKTALHFPHNVNVPDAAKDLIRQLICDPSERLTYEGIVQHPFFQDVDFATIREHTPPYLPPVGQLDDVGNFSGGGARARDDALHDISNDVTISPSRGLYPTPQRVNQLQRLSNLENVDPQSAKEIQRRAIIEAAAVPLTEEVQEVEDIAWQGPAYAADLPFVGFSFTPTMLIGESQCRQRQLRALIDNSTMVQSRLSILEASTIGEEAMAKIMEVKRRNRFLEKQITLQEDEIQASGIIFFGCSHNLRKRLQTSVFEAEILTDLDSVVNNSIKQQSEERQEVLKLEARVNALTLEKAKLVEELSETRKCLLDFNSLKDLLNSVDRKAVDEAHSLKVKLDQADENSRLQSEELTQVRQQLERLRNSNTKLVAERDAAIARAVKAEESAAAQADEAEAARVAANNEVLRLTTTTEQQGKLINHLLNLLPAERRKTVSGGNGGPATELIDAATPQTLPSQPPIGQVPGGVFVRSRSRWLGGRTKPSTGHSALFLKTRSMLKGKKTTAGTSVAGAGAHKFSLALIGDAIDVKKSAVFKSMIGLGSTQRDYEDNGNHPHPSTSRSRVPPPKRRMAAWVRTLSTLRSKKLLHNATTETAKRSRSHLPDSNAFTEDDVDADTGGVYMGDDMSLEYPPLEADYIVSDVDYMRGSASTLSSLRSSSLQSLPETACRVMWPEQYIVPQVQKSGTAAIATGQKSKEPHPFLLKQISRVLGKGKAKAGEE